MNSKKHISKTEVKINKYKKYLPNIVSGKTSLTDNDGYGYTDVCRLAAEYDSIFKIFKRSNDYRRVLEHVTKNQGQDYLNIIKTEGKGLLRYMFKFKENDRIGSPIRFKYDIGEISPTTLRYVKVLLDLKVLFGDLNDLNIVEIGAGYGGAM